MIGEKNWRHFSFIVKRNTIYSIGYNNTNKTHPLAHKYGYRFCNLHSELSAIIKFDGKISDLARFTMINVRISKDNKVRMSRPCKICQHLLSVFNFKEVFYSTNIETFAQLY